MEYNYFGSFLSAVAVLRRVIPPKNYSVVVRRVALKDDAGSCDLDEKNKQFCIKVSNKLSTDAAILILIHEWAHALAWEGAEHPEVEEEGHGSLFGHYYAIVWRHWCGEINAKKKPSEKKKRKKDI